MRKQTILTCMIAAFAILIGSHAAFAQGVTTGAISGIVVDQSGVGLPGATVLAVHEPSGTRYGTSTLADGRFNIPGMRVGGPYKITISYIGYETQELGDVFLALGGTANFNFVLRDAAALLGEVVVTFTRDAIFSSDRTGASTSIGQNELQSLPSFSKRIGDFTRLSPMASGNSFAGADNRLNNITIDGSYFNNSFGLAGQPGDRTGVAPVSISAIEAITVNIAPYDVRQGHFVGAGINTVTKSGTNQLKGEVYYNFRNSNMVGREAQELTFDPGTFKFDQWGFNIGGPIIKNKLFFFVDFGQEVLEEPGTTFQARTSPTQTVGGNITRVLASDLDALSAYLKNNFGYETGPYQGYMHQTPALRFIGKLDFNINDRNKVSVRYNHLDSETDVLLSNSSSLGWGSRRTNLNGLNFQNSNYIIMENIRSVVGEWNSRIGENMFNNLIFGYTFQDESRKSRGTMFPMVDILDGGNVYTTFGFEPFTPNNELRYSTWQLQNNFSIFRENHTLTFGFSGEKYYSENIFFPGSQSVYVYNSLDDFYADANNYLNPDPAYENRIVRRFQVRWSNIPGQEKPIQPLNVFYAGIYGQDEWQVNDQLKLTLGLRVDVPFFGEGEYKNPEVPGFVFRDENGKDVSYRTEKLPDPRPHWSPRLGFNYDVTGDRSTQLRGGTGIFTGTPAYVWISNQIGNNGMLTGFERLDNTTARPFNPNPNAYKPATVTGDPASQYELAFTDPKFKFPQIWRTNIAVDQKLPWGLIGTLEAIYSRDVNGIYYINANLVEPTQTFSGPDNRPLYPGGAANRIIGKIDNAIVLKNQNIGYAYNFAASLEKPFTRGLYAKVAYSYGIAKNTIDPGSIAFGSWNNNQHGGNPNNPGLGFSSNSAGHRAIAVLSYTTPSSTTFSFFAESRTIGNFSYVYSGDMNRDGGTSNDLIYIPKDKSEMNFFQFTAAGRTFTVQEQEDAWEAFIRQDKYLSKNRGKIAERGAAFLPMVTRVDFSVSHDLIANIAGTRNRLQVRLDIINIGNMLNKEWGVSQRAVVTNPLVVRPAAQGGPVDTDGKPIYRLANVGDQLISKTTQQTLGVGDVYRIQFGVRYIFN